MLAKIRAGEDFDAVMEAYNEDASTAEQMALGYPIAEGSTMYGDEFKAGAMALEHVGDVSEPFATSLGIHIVEYASDAKGGAVALTQEQRESMAKAVLLEEKYQILQDRLKIWQKDYDIETNPELIALPEDLT